MHLHCNERHETTTFTTIVVVAIKPLNRLDLVAKGKLRDSAEVILLVIIILSLFRDILYLGFHISAAKQIKT